MPRKTIYVKDEDVATFARAEDLAGTESLSSVIADSLRQFVSEAEQAKGSDSECVRIILGVRDPAGYPRRKAFKGRWILPLESPIPTNFRRHINDVESVESRESRMVSVAISGSGRFVFYIHGKHELDGQILTYDTLEQAAEYVGMNLIDEVLRLEGGPPIEELDV